MLARAGHRVVAFDQFERAAPVGSGFLLQPTGMSVLQSLGLLEAVAVHGAVITRFFGRDSDAGRLVLDLRYDALNGGLHGLGVLRSAVFDVLFQAAQDAGVGIETGKTVTGTETAAAGRKIVFADGGRSAPFDLVVDALGQRSVLRPVTSAVLRYGALWASIDWPDDAGFDPNSGEQRYRRASKMIGVVPSGTSAQHKVPQATFFWSIRGDDLPAWQAAPLDGWKDEVRALWPQTEPLLDKVTGHDDLTFAQYRHSTLACPVAPALAHIGDSYHATSPQLGQGANMALLDAYALAQGMMRGATVEDAFDHYLWARAAHVRLFQAMSRAFTPVYQSDSAMLPLLRDHIVAPISRVPPVPRLLAKMVTGLLGNPLGRLGLDLVATGKRSES